MCRRIGLAKTLMDDLEGISDARDCKFVDLYVRRQNKQAISMYERLGYYVHEVVKDYYQGFDDPSVTEDAFDMHKILKGWMAKKNPRLSSAIQHIQDDMVD
jgi:N-terminal acetyltransferase B complex catalytic subunit